MKNRVSRILSVGIALAAVAALNAQQNTMTANVPFSFYMGSTAMPQGAYRIGETSGGAVVWISSKQSNATNSITTCSVAGKKVEEPARLVFHRYGEDYFLAQIWTGDGSNGRALPRSRREKELAQSGAGRTLAMIQVSLHR